MSESARPDEAVVELVISTVSGQAMLSRVAGVLDLYEVADFHYAVSGERATVRASIRCDLGRTDRAVRRLRRLIGVTDVRVS